MMHKFSYEHNIEHNRSKQVNILISKNQVLQIFYLKSKSKFSCTETPKTSLKSDLGANRQLNNHSIQC